jgi:hypothetical protein
MLETYLISPITRKRLRTGPAADHIDAFADWLHRQGYSPTSIDNLLPPSPDGRIGCSPQGFTAQDLLPGFNACKFGNQDGALLRSRSVLTPTLNRVARYRVKHNFAATRRRRG